MLNCHKETSWQAHCIRSFIPQIRELVVRLLQWLKRNTSFCTWPRKMNFLILLARSNSCEDPFLCLSPFIPNTHTNLNGICGWDDFLRRKNYQWPLRSNGKINVMRVNCLYLRRHSKLSCRQYPPIKVMRVNCLSWRRHWKLSRRQQPSTYPSQNEKYHQWSCIVALTNPYCSHQTFILLRVASLLLLPQHRNLSGRVVHAWEGRTVHAASSRSCIVA